MSNSRVMVWTIGIGVMICLGAFTSSEAWAAELSANSVEDRLNRLEAAQTGVSGADNAWLLVCSALVLMMTAPGLALFYGGLVRHKNVLGTMMHSMAAMALVTVLWMVCGYSLAFGEGNAFIGYPGSYWMLQGVGGSPNSTYAATVPHQTFMLFQLMFAIITPALISGAYAERIRFRAFLWFSGLWLFFVYCPLAHMVWGQGGLFNWALGGRWPVLDFAGGIVVHISSGASALVCAYVLGRRMGFPSDPMPPHNVVLSLTGTGLLWVGWFGFNAGSALNSGGLATSTFAATHFSAAGAAISWAALEWRWRGHPSALGIASGMVAGLASITPASGFVTVPSALIIGLVGGAACFLAVTKLKARFRYDDSLDVFGVHCVGSVVGMLLCGVFASGAVNPAIVSTFSSAGQVVSLAGGGRQLIHQLVGVLFAAVYSAGITYLLLKVLDRTVGLRVDDEAESLGLDLTQHGESAYND